VDTEHIRQARTTKSGVPGIGKQRVKTRQMRRMRGRALTVGAATSGRRTAHAIAQQDEQTAAEAQAAAAARTAVADRQAIHMRWGREGRTTARQYRHHYYKQHHPH
jgi:hypothetical protein